MPRPRRGYSAGEESSEFVETGARRRYDYAAGGEAKNLVLESDLMPIVAATPRKQPAEGRSEISPP